MTMTARRAPAADRSSWSVVVPGNGSGWRLAGTRRGPVWSSVTAPGRAPALAPVHRPPIRASGSRSVREASAAPPRSARAAGSPAVPPPPDPGPRRGRAPAARCDRSPGRGERRAPIRPVRAMPRPRGRAGPTRTLPRTAPRSPGRSGRRTPGAAGRDRHAGLVRLPDVRVQGRIALMAEVLQRHRKALESQALITIRGGRIRITHPRLS